MKLGTFLAAQAVSQPDRTALVCGDQSMTFRDLHEASDRVATGLRDGGVKIGDRVAMLLPNRCEFVMLFMAIVKCGGIALPLNHRLSPKELRLIIEDAEPAVIFFEGGDRSTVDALLDGLAIGRCAMDGAAATGELSFQDLLSTNPAFIEIPPELDDCMISYTSGTTGRPKGVITTQANYIVSNGYLNGLQWQLTSADRILITTPLAHRAGFARVGNVIALGCTLFMQRGFNVAELMSIIETQAITVIGIVPTVGRKIQIVADSRRHGRSIPDGHQAKAP
jgi:long-chain acyl-CoA synthetase